MSLKYAPKQGTIVVCDFEGFIAPEMNKRRPVIVISPKIQNRDKLCTILPLSTTQPDPFMPYHYELQLNPPMPYPYDNPVMWVKADMIYNVSLDRLSFLYNRKDRNGKRNYIKPRLDQATLNAIIDCFLHSIGR